MGFPPLHMAILVVDEVRSHFCVELPESAEDYLAERATKVFAHNPPWRRRVSGPSGRAHLRGFMRHWLSSWLRRNRPALSEQLPGSFLNGYPLPLPCDSEQSAV